MNEKINIDELIASVPVDAWVAIGIFFLCGLFLIIYVFYSDRVRRYTEQSNDFMLEINQALRHMNQSVEHMNESIEVLAVRLGEFANAVQKSVDYNFLMSKDYSETEFTERRKSNEH